jgi:hypothetical protein
MTNPKNGVMRRTDGVELKDHIACLLEEIDKRYEQRFAAQERATASALASAQLAVDKAELNTREWQRNSNEWRGAMSDKDKLFVTVTSYRGLCEKVDALESLRDVASGKASQNAMLFTAALALAGFLIGIIRLFTK